MKCLFKIFLTVARQFVICYWLRTTETTFGEMSFGEMSFDQMSGKVEVTSDQNIATGKNRDFDVIAESSLNYHFSEMIINLPKETNLGRVDTGFAKLASIFLSFLLDYMMQSFSFCDHATRICSTWRLVTLKEKGLSHWDYDYSPSVSWWQGHWTLLGLRTLRLINSQPKLCCLGQNWLKYPQMQNRDS